MRSSYVIVREMSWEDWHGRPGRDMYRGVDFGSEHVAGAGDLAVQAAELQRLQEARAHILASQAHYNAQVSQYNAQVDHLQRRLDAFSFENPWSDCTLTHVTHVTDPIAYIEL